MPIQASLDLEHLKIIPPASVDDMGMVLANQGERYWSYAEAIAPRGGVESSTYWRVVFSLLSVGTSLKANEAAYRLLLDNPEVLPDQDRLSKLLGLVRAGGSHSTVPYHKTKARYISIFTNNYWKEGIDNTPFLWDNFSESLSDYRHRLMGMVKGLGIAKSSFAVALMYPTISDVVCLDRHMLRLLGWPKPSIPIAAYLELERMVVNIGQETGHPGFIAQWCLWDAIRGSDEAHSSLKEG